MLRSCRMLLDIVNKKPFDIICGWPKYRHGVIYHIPISILHSIGQSNEEINFRNWTAMTSTMTSMTSTMTSMTTMINTPIITNVTIIGKNENPEDTYIMIIIILSTFLFVLGISLVVT